MSPPPYPPVDGSQPCRDEPDMWFPSDGVNPREAKALCGRCPFQDECLRYALHNKVEGVWGGTSAKQRDVMRRHLLITALPVQAGFPHNWSRTA